MRPPDLSKLPKGYISLAFRDQDLEMKGMGAI
jgi:hypothetical protein